MIKLSIVIVNYNTKELLKKCLLSIEKFPPKIGLEVIVVDNSSTDESVQLVENLKLKIKNLSLIQNETNLGFAKASNIGIRKADGKHILLLNSDAEVTKDSLSKLVEFAEKQKDAGVIGAKLLNPDGSLQPSVYRLPTLLGAIKFGFLGESRYFEKYAPATSHRSLVAVDAVVGAAFLITPEACKKVGLLDERYFMYFEDLDYCRRVKDAGLYVYYLSDSAIIHHHGAAGKGSQKTKKYLIDSSKVYHGLVKYYLITFVLRIGQKIGKIVR